MHRMLKTLIVGILVIGGITSYQIKEDKFYSLADKLPTVTPITQCDVAPRGIVKKVPKGSYEDEFIVTDIIYNSSTKVFSLVAIDSEDENHLLNLCKVDYYSTHYHNFLRKFFIDDKVKALIHTKDNNVWAYEILDKYTHNQMDELGLNEYLNHVCGFKAKYDLTFQ